MRQIDPLVDCVFKAILGVQEHDWMLIQFLNAILKLPVPIKSVIIQNPYSEKEFEGDKQTIVDVLASDQDGRLFQVEIQLKMHAALAERLLYTWATTYRSQLTSGAEYDRLRPTYAIWLMREPLSSVKSQAAHLCFEAYDRTHHALLSPQMQIHVLQLARWRAPAPDASLDEESAWLYFFKEAKSWRELPVNLRLPPMEKAMNVLKRFSENEAEYHRYQAREHWLHLQATLENSARRAREELAQTQEELSQAQETLSQKQEELSQKQEELSQTQEELSQTQEELSQTQREAQRLREETERTQREARATEDAKIAAERRAQQEAARAARLAERLRALGVVEEP